MKREKLSQKCVKNATTKKENNKKTVMKLQTWWGTLGIKVFTKKLRFDLNPKTIYATFEKNKQEP